MRWTRSDSADAIVDFRGRRVRSIIANDSMVPLTAFNGAHIRLPAAHSSRARTQSRRSTFVTDIAPTGASIIKTHDPDGSDYLYTLLVPADANQLFPCFDQPDLKARVTFTLTAPRAWTRARERRRDRGPIPRAAATHHFNETKPISTYLIAFAAGPWTSATSTVNGRTINVYVRKSRATKPTSTRCSR